MRRIVRITAILGIVLPALMSCRAISNFLHDDEVVAEVGTEKLYRSDLDAVIPRGTSPEDSTRLAVQYINTWASDLIYVSIAEQQLSKADRDVSAELEDYRKSLLKYRYEQLYVNERLDTAVSDENIQAYYEKHQDKFVLGRPLVKARYLRIHTDSPGLEPIRKKMGSSEVDDLVEADSLAFSAAMRFAAWNNEWIDVAVLAREFGMSYESMLGLMKDGWIRQDDTLGVTSLAYVSEMMKKGELAPIEYSAPQIRDMILSARKQNLITVLEQDLLDEARENGQFVIF
ncbi:MAG: hypothetical protein II989_07715 [Bacteroidales bacterium]|nr:hypothetical protein [Bacteroidales bacterium]MBQ3613965.1 hypothetical protein [Bacteroidales bacterium]